MIKEYGVGKYHLLTSILSVKYRTFRELLFIIIVYVLIWGGGQVCLGMLVKDRGQLCSHFSPSL